MIYVVVALVAASVGLVVLGLGQLVVSGESRTLQRRLATVSDSQLRTREVRERRERQARRERLEGFLETVGATVGKDQIERSTLRDLLIQAGHRSAAGPAVFVGIRAVTALGLGFGAFVGVSAVGAELNARVLVTGFCFILGWLLPFMVLRRQARSRQDQIRRALPDALDLMVVCVEAGLGMNQAIVRVGDEMARVSRALADEFTLVSLEMRAGTPREDALRHLGERTGVSDIRALVSMLIQTDRFGTSIADSLRIHAEELRSKRQQAAEEEAAKITVKILIPLVIFVFPAIFVVILGPAVFHFLEFAAGQ